MNSWNRTKNLISIALLCSPLASAQLTYPNFVQCVEGHSGAASCQLDNGGPYTVTSTITVGRAPLTITGTGANSVLMRAESNITVTIGTNPPPTLSPTYPAPILDIGTNVTGSGAIVIEGPLTFNGNRASQCYHVGSNSPVCITYPSIGNPGVQFEVNSNPVAYENALAWFAGFFDEIKVESTNTNPVTISGITMYDAPGQGIEIEGGLTSSSNVTVVGSTFGLQTGIHGCAYRACIQMWGPSESEEPYNPVIGNTALSFGTFSNTFYGTGGAAIAVPLATKPVIASNSFFDNMREFPLCPTAGGQAVYLQASSTSNQTTDATVYNNVLNGNNEQDYTCANGAPGAGGSSGLEIQGANHLIQGNYVEQHMGDGISLDGVSCINLDGNTVTGNGGDYLFNHYEITVKGTIIATTNVLLDGNYVYHNPCNSSDSPCPQVVGPPTPTTTNVEKSVPSGKTFGAPPGFWAWPGGQGVTNIEYSANTSNSSYFYDNSAGNVASGSAASGTVSCSVPTPIQ